MAKRNRERVKQNREEKKCNGSRQTIQKDKFQEERKQSVTPLFPQNERQKQALEFFTDKQLNVLSGSAGVGKSTLVVWWACKRWLEGSCTNIVITRPAQTLGKDGGAVPGGDEMKLLMYVYPMLKLMKKYLGVGVLMNNLKMDTAEALFMESSGIQIVPIEKLGGFSFDENTILIADEIQSATVAQVKALATRAEEGCQVLICGDVTQSPLQGVNGLAYLENALTKNPHELAGVTSFLPEDCQRKGISAHLTRVFETEGQW